MDSDLIRGILDGSPQYAPAQTRSFRVSTRPCNFVVIEQILYISRSPDTSARCTYNIEQEGQSTTTAFLEPSEGRYRGDTRTPQDKGRNYQVQRRKPKIPIQGTWFLCRKPLRCTPFRHLSMALRLIFPILALNNLKDRRCSCKHRGSSTTCRPQSRRPLSKRSQKVLT
jgi:hypothetical protein